MALALALGPTLLGRAVIMLVLTAAVVVGSTTAAVAAIAPDSFDTEVLVESLTVHHLSESAVDPHAEAVAPEPVVFASVDGVDLSLPGEVRKVGFHESGSSEALPLEPAGRLEVNENSSRLALPAVRGDSDTDYMVLPTRNRSGGPTTAVDISMVLGSEVLSPVDGTVTAVEDYTLYGRTPDTVVEIMPDGAPDLLVRMLHIEDVQVGVGDTLTAGSTRVAETARPLPFDSQIDRYAGTHPHVHLEVRGD